ncbi:MAG: hypothetical protein A2X99_08915 [Deltaproteobacteria bacterium GWB2_55_19]|nr:MAG: hypothetical protein A2X99_08915 [Deltaproteobacteria bacterium GWB2_55_19]
MGTRTVAETIREITRAHLEGGGMLLGESISAVGWVNNTVPDAGNIMELPMTDVAGAGIAVGSALAGRRPIFVVRFQDFLILNGSPLIFYAAKLKGLHEKSAPVFVRAIAAEGLGPVHSGVLHSLFMHFPGFKVASPMTPREYEDVWRVYMESDDPFICSEHRASYSNKDELTDEIMAGADITIYAISATRFEAKKAARLLKNDGVRCNVVNIVWLKPFTLTKRITEPLKESRIGLVVDPGHEIAGASESIAYSMMINTGYPVKALGLEDRTKCLCPPLQNRAPDAGRIVEAAKELLAGAGRVFT